MAETPKPQAGTWTLIAPDGARSWQAPSPIACVALEQRERVPPQVALQRIMEAADEPTELEKSLTAALAELVAVKDIKERAAALHFAGPSGPLGEGWEAEWKRLQREYIERQPKAWAAARAALALGVSGAPDQTFSRQTPMEPRK